MSNLGRVASRDGRFDEAAERLASAGDLLRSIGAEALLLETDAREVERLVLAGEHESALAQATELQRLASQARASPTSLILLDRLEGCARGAERRPRWQRGPHGTGALPPAGSAAPSTRSR